MPVSGRTLREKIQAGQIIVGAFVTLTDPAVVEIACRAGFDFIFFEFEHGLRDQRQLLELIRVADISGTPALVRANSLTPNLVGRMLDSGAAGIVISQAHNAQDVRDVISWAKFPPEGIRGAAGQRGLLAGRMAASSDPYQVANDEVLIIAIAELPESVENIEAILDVPGLTGVLPGPGDLALSMGRLPRDHPELRRQLDRVAAATVARKDRVLIHFCTDAGQVGPSVQSGARAILLGPDQLFLTRALAEVLKQAREAC